MGTRYIRRIKGCMGTGISTRGHKGRMGTRYIPRVKGCMGTGISTRGQRSYGNTVQSNFRMVEIFSVIRKLKLRTFPCTIIMFYVTMLSCTNIKLNGYFIQTFAPTKITTLYTPAVNGKLDNTRLSSIHNMIMQD